MNSRRHEIDAIRMGALLLLILYHIAIGFQAWGPYIGFITNDKPLGFLWVPMSLINIWRIPILFVISGMAVYLALDKRTLPSLLKDRTIRILIPLFFGTISLVPIYSSLFQNYYDKPLVYSPSPGHLWFLVNIWIYILVLLPIFSHMKRKPDNIATKFISYLINKPGGVIFVFGIPLILEAVIVSPKDYPNFTFWSSAPIHGLLVGVICFFYGFSFISLGDQFWDSAKRVRFYAVLSAGMLYLIRLTEVVDNNYVANALTSLEAACWIISVIGFGTTYLNKPTRIVTYLSPAVYPIYVIHMPIQFFLSSLVFPLDIPAITKLILLLMGTYIGGLLIFEIVKRLKWIRVLFGMKI